MEQGSRLQELIRRVRAGDPEAAAELVRDYRSHILRAARIEMRDQRLRRVLDSDDICQSVLKSFLARLALGQYDVDEPEQLLRLLATMARNKVATQARKAQVARRDERDPEACLAAEARLADPTPCPARVATDRDLLAECRRRLSAEERRLADLRAVGRDWNQVAAEVGGSPDALRKQLARAVDRVARQLGLDDDDGDQ